MTQLLAINSSPKVDNSSTRILVDFFVEQWAQQHPQTQVTPLDVGRNPPPHIDDTMIGAYYTAPSDRSEAQQAAITLSEQLVDQIEACDVVVIGSPMHNFSITSGLKAYIDHIARAGRTFKHTDKGKVGLLKNKKVFVLSARGGNYSVQGPVSHKNFQDTYLKAALEFMGMDDITFITAEDIARSSDGIQGAKQAIASAINS